MVDCNLPLDLDLPEIVASSGGGLCVGCEVESRQKRGSGVGSEWATGEHGGARGVLYGGGELGPRWSRVDAIGLGGRCSGAALYAECSEVSSCVGGVLVWSENSQIQ
jgi:hypothetical protein